MGISFSQVPIHLFLQWAIPKLPLSAWLCPGAAPGLRLVTEAERGAERAGEPWGPSGWAASWKCLCMGAPGSVRSRCCHGAGWKGVQGEGSWRQDGSLPGRVFWEGRVSVGSWLVFQACLEENPIPERLKLQAWHSPLTGLAGRVVMWPEQKDRVEAWAPLGATKCIHPGVRQAGVWPGLCFCRRGPQTTALGWGGLVKADPRPPWADWAPGKPRIQCPSAERQPGLDLWGSQGCPSLQLCAAAAAT